MFIVIEGVDGAGKTTITKHLSEKLRELGHKVTTTSEPCNTEFSKKIKALVTKDTIPIEDLFLFNVARIDNYRNIIAPALARNEIVLSDRFTLSSFTYQNTIPRKIASQLSDIALCNIGIKFHQPNALIILTTTPEIAKARVESRDSKEDDIQKFNNKSLDWYKQIVHAYKEAILNFSKSESNVTKFIEIDTTTLDVAGCVEQILDEFNL